MSKSTYPLKLPNSIKLAAAELAREEGVSLNEFIAAAVAAFTGAGTPPVIRSIRRAGDELPAWGRLGRQEQIASRKIP